MRAAVVAAALVLLAGCGGGGDEEVTTPVVPERITLESPAFNDGEQLPARFTCDGEGVSPPLRWSGVPDTSLDLALVVDDPDAPGGTFTHWTVWKLPFQEGGQGRVLEDNVAPEMDQGENDFGDRGWGPPCPPEGDDPHRYVFTLYALDRVLPLSKGARVDDVRDAIADAATAEGRIEATYGR